MFDLIRYYNAKTNRESFAKELDNGRVVMISWRRYKKFIVKRSRMTGL